MSRRRANRASGIGVAQNLERPASYLLCLTFVSESAQIDCMNSKHNLLNQVSSQFSCRTYRSLRRSVRLSVAAGLVGLAAQFPVRTQAQAFLFETTPAGDYPGSLMVSSGSQTLTVTPEGFPSGSVTVLLRASPLNQGVTGNQGSTPVFGSFAPLRFTFSQPIGSITFGFEDAVPGSAPGTGGGDIDGSVTIQGYDSANNLLGTLFYNNPTYDGGTYETLGGNFSGASYFIASTASSPGNPNSLVYEIVDSTVVPEPSSLALLFCCGAACGALALRRRFAS
jgi:hypothetical protein